MAFKNKKINSIIIINLFIIFIFLKDSFSEIQNKLIATVGKQPISTFDIEQEIIYLKILSSQAETTIEDSEFEKIALESLIKEKIKYIVIKKQENLKTEEEFLQTNLTNIYTKLGLKNLNEFKIYINEKGIDYTEFKNKIDIELKWNQLIFTTFGSRVKIDKDKIDKKIKNLAKKKIEVEFLISEIFFTAKNKQELQIKTEDILESINLNGFETSAIKYSEAQTSTNGGKLGWVSEAQMSEDILNKLKKIKIGEITKIISIGGGNLILKLNEQRENEKEINIQGKIDKIVSNERNRQLNNFSIFFFKKVKNNTKIKNY